MDQEYELEQFLTPEGGIKLTTQGSVDDFARLPHLEVVVEEEYSMPQKTSSESDYDLSLTPNPYALHRSIHNT